MEPHPLTAATERLIEERGAPMVLDVEHSIQVHKPTLSGSDSPTSYYIRPPDGMSADDLIKWFESLPEYLAFHLTLVSVLGIDTFHQPLISTDDFAKKYFHDNRQRVVRVVGKTDQAIEAMAVFVKALKRPFDPATFPHFGDFSVSSYHPPEPGRAEELKLLFKPADHSGLMRVEREVALHLDEINLGTEIVASRHMTRSQAPELILASISEASTGLDFIQTLADSLPKATPDEIAAATDASQHGPARSSVDNHEVHTRFVQPQVPMAVFAPPELRRRVIASLADILRANRFADGAEIKIVQGGAAIEVGFPRTAKSLWLSTTFNEKTHIKDVANCCVGVKTDPLLRNGWTAHYNFDSSAGALHIRIVDADSAPPSGWKSVPLAG